MSNNNNGKKIRREYFTTSEGQKNRLTANIYSSREIQQTEREIEERKKSGEKMSGKRQA